ncbi:MAG TPA: hypothetical protein VMW51_06935 [Terriglobia bacterium]|nr:hypothetical protein [Terriglobia bacterium]
MSSTAPQSSNIGELINRFQVCWDVWPEYTFINHEKRQIGFELDLAGTHEDGSEHAAPGCEKCREIYRALVQIAEDVLPTGNKDTTHQFEPYDQGIHYSPRRGNRPEVILRIRIIHRKAFDSPVDEPQFRYLKELQQHLEERGISQR